MKFASISVLAVALSSTAGLAQSINLPLSGAAEIPPITTVATGNAALTYNTATTQLSWIITWSGLNNGGTNQTSIFAHIHVGNGPGRSNGPVAIDFGNNINSGVSGSIFLNTLTNARLAGLWAGLGYVNVHSDTFRGGELRGDIPAGFIPAPGAAALLGLGALAAGRRRR
jgi:hypothetical protein